MKKGDIIIFSVIAVIALVVGAVFLFGNSGDSIMVVVEKNGVEVKRVSIDQSGVIWEDEHNCVEIEDKQVFMEWSDCKNQICVHAGKISSAGQQIVCLPNRVMIRLEGYDQEVDYIAH